MGRWGLGREPLFGWRVPAGSCAVRAGVPSWGDGGVSLPIGSGFASCGRVFVGWRVWRVACVGAFAGCWPLRRSGGVWVVLCPPGLVLARDGAGRLGWRAQDWARRPAFLSDPARRSSSVRGQRVPGAHVRTKHKVGLSWPGP